MGFLFEDEEVEYRAVAVGKGLNEALEDSGRDFFGLDGFVVSHVGELVHEGESSLFPEACEGAVHDDSGCPGPEAALAAEFEAVHGAEYLHEGVLEDVLHIGPVRDIAGAYRGKIPGITLVKEPHSVFVLPLQAVQELLFAKAGGF